MRLFAAFLICGLASTSALRIPSPPSAQPICDDHLEEELTESPLSQPAPQHQASSLHLPTVRESAIAARRILKLASIATLSSVFPAAGTSANSTSRAAEDAARRRDDDNIETIYESRPRDVAGAAVGLMEYYATCPPHAYNPTIIGITIATAMRNAAAGSNVTLSLRWQVPAHAPPAPDPWAYFPANLPRFSLIGYIERIPDRELGAGSGAAIEDCFFGRHPESRLWAPGTDVHESWWARLVVQEVYWFGGFGDRARIGWLPVEVWRAVREEEVDAFRLMGETEDERGGTDGTDGDGRAAVEIEEGRRVPVSFEL